MWRRLRKRILIASLLGAVTTIAVAWTCGWLSDLDPTTDRRWEQVTAQQSPDDAPIAAEDLIRLAQWRGIGIEEVHLWVPLFENAPGIDLTEALDLQPLHPPNELSHPPSWGPLHTLDRDFLLPGENKVRTFLAQGWPWPALWCERDVWNSAITGGYHLSSEHIPGTFMMTSHVLCFRPSWPEFALCTMFYGSAWMLLLFVPGVIRRIVRQCRNRCLACGYDLRAATGDVCPECGAEFTRTSTPLAASHCEHPC